MALFQIYGVISEIKPSTKGYTRLAILTCIPFKNKITKFNVWDTLLLKKLQTMEPFKIGEEVQVEYSYKGSYPQLVSMKPSLIDHCPVCNSSLEPIDAQRVECDGCRLIPSDEHKTKVDTQMLLASNELKDVQGGKGYYLELYCLEENKAFKPVVYESNLLFSEIPNLKVGCSYRVTGWLSPNGRYLDISKIN